MEKKIVRSQYGVWIEVYEIEHEGRILWFRTYEIESAARRYACSVNQEDEYGDESFVIRMD